MVPDPRRSEGMHGSFGPIGALPRRLWFPCLLVWAAFVSPAVLAAAGEDSDRSGWFPSLAVSAVRDDNILRVEDAASSDTILVAEPAVDWKSLFGKHSLEIHFDGILARYHANAGENYSDGTLSGQLSLDLSPRVTVDLGGGAQRSHDYPGESGTRPRTTTGPDRWRENTFSGNLTYGRRSNPGQVGITVQSASRTYTNNGQEGRDRNADTVEARFAWNLTQKTALYLSAEQTAIDYVNPAPVTLDSTDRRLSVGTSWDITGITSGDARIGSTSKNLKDPALKDFQGFYLSAQATWEPVAVDRLRLTALRETRESDQFTASYYLADQLTGIWEHQLTALVAANILIRTERDDYSDGRLDTLRKLALGLDFDVTERMTIDATYQMSQRNSNVAGLSYDDRFILLSLALRAL